ALGHAPGGAAYLHVHRVEGRQQGRDQERRREAVRRARGGRPHRQLPGQVATRRPARRPPAGLQEGGRKARRGRYDRRVRGYLMSTKKFKPVTPGTRFRSVIAQKDVITRDEPERSLLEPLKKSGGRNHHGHVTSRRRGGGAKRRYR